MGYRQRRRSSYTKRGHNVREQQVKRAHGDGLDMPRGGRFEPPTEEEHRDLETPDSR